MFFCVRRFVVRIVFKLCFGDLCVRFELSALFVFCFFTLSRLWFSPSFFFVFAFFSFLSYRLVMYNLCCFRSTSCLIWSFSQFFVPFFTLLGAGVRRSAGGYISQPTRLHIRSTSPIHVRGREGGREREEDEGKATGERLGVGSRVFSLSYCCVAVAVAVVMLCFVVYGLLFLQWFSIFSSTSFGQFRGILKFRNLGDSVFFRITAWLVDTLVRLFPLYLWCCFCAPSTCHWFLWLLALTMYSFGWKK